MLDLFYAYGKPPIPVNLLLRTRNEPQTSDPERWIRPLEVDLQNGTKCACVT